MKMYSFKQFFLSLRPSKLTLETKVDVMIMLSQGPEAITMLSAQNPFLRTSRSFG